MPSRFRELQIPVGSYSRTVGVLESSSLESSFGSRLPEENRGAGDRVVIEILYTYRYGGCDGYAGGSIGGLLQKLDRAGSAGNVSQVEYGRSKHPVHISRHGVRANDCVCRGVDVRVPVG